MRGLKLCLCMLVLPIIAACGEGGGSKTPALSTGPTGGLTTTLPSSDATGSYSAIPSDIVEAAKSLAPVVQLHSKEIYYPCSVDYYLQQCGLRSPDGTLSPTWITKDTLVSAAAGSHLEVDDSHWQERGWSVKDGETWLMNSSEKWPAYVALATVTVGDQPNEFLIMQYNTFYAYNTLSTAGSDGRFADNHWADWERVSVIAERPKGTTGDWKFKAIITRSHNNPLKTTPSPETDNGQKKVYSALHAHGTFNSWTDLGDATTWGDLRDSEGIKWRLHDAPNEVVDYHNYWFASKKEFDNSASLSDSANQYGTSYYRVKWIDFPGPWGVSTEDNDIITYVDQEIPYPDPLFFNLYPVIANYYHLNITSPFTGNSPWSGMGVTSLELVELGKLL